MHVVSLYINKNTKKTEISRGSDAIPYQISISQQLIAHLSPSKSIKKKEPFNKTPFKHNTLKINYLSLFLTYL